VCRLSFFLVTYTFSLWSDV